MGRICRVQQSEDLSGEQFLPDLVMSADEVSGLAFKPQSLKRLTGQPGGDDISKPLRDDDLARLECARQRRAQAAFGLCSLNKGAVGADPGAAPRQFFAEVDAQVAVRTKDQPDQACSVCRLPAKHAPALARSPGMRVIGRIAALAGLMSVRVHRAIISLLFIKPVLASRHDDAVAVFL